MILNSDITSDELSDAIRLFGKHMVMNSIWHIKALDLRSTILLQKNDLLPEVRLTQISQFELNVLLHPDHPSRLSIPPGPMLVYFAIDNNSQATMMHIEDLLLSPDHMVRNAAMNHFDLLVNSDQKFFTVKAKSFISQRATDLRDENPNHWQPAAIEITDVLRDDFFFNLAGFRQSIALQIGNPRYIQKILHPSYLSLDNADIHIWNPSTQRTEIQQTIQKCVDESISLQDACNRYYYALGYIPLIESLSMGSLVDKWVQIHGNKDQVWNDIWTWADSIPSPLPRYHACSVFMERPYLVPHDKLEQIWKESSNVTHVFWELSRTSNWTSAWLIRCELARHYIYHIESHFPNNDSELIAGLAWWLAEQVSCIFGNTPEIINGVLQQIVLPAESQSRSVWHLTHPMAKVSILRCNTLFVSSIWSLSLLCNTAILMKGISVDNADLAVRSDIDKAVTLAAIQTFPMEPSPHDEFTYAFDRGLLGTAEAWSGTQANNEEPSPLEFLIRAIPMVEITDWLHKALENLSSTDIGNQVLIASLIRMKTYMGVIPADTIWEFISDPKWARKALLSLDLSALEIFCQAMTEIQVQYNDKWAIQMPHFYAYGCEQIEAKGERRKALFAYTIIGSINGGTTSAIRRLLHGRFKGRFRGDRADIRKYLESFRSILPAWASAKLRAIMANLHIT